MTELEFLKDLNGENYDTLRESLQEKIEETQIVAYIIKPGTPPKVKYNIFRRINTGGLVLEPQEIRHALNQGLPAKYVAELAELQEFKQVTEKKISSGKECDREFVTRFIAFYMNEPESYTPDLDTFLNNSMAQINKLSESDIIKMKQDFIQSMIASKDIFGNWAFRKRIYILGNVSLLIKHCSEVWSVNLAKLNNNQRNVLVSRRRFNEFICRNDAFRYQIY